MHDNGPILPSLGRFPLELSEILDTVFSFLGQQALQTVSLVSRQWHLIALRHLNPSFHWNGLQSAKGDSGYHQELETTRKKLMEARILICGQQSPRYGRIPQERKPGATAGWEASLELVKEIAQEGQLWTQQLTLRLYPDSWDFGISLFPRLDGPPIREGIGSHGMGVHLRELMIETNGSNESFPLQWILENCPRLVRLTLRATHHAITTRLERYRPLPSREGPCGLKYLTFENLTIEATVFQEYFPRLSNLKELRLIVLQGDPTEGDRALIFSRATQSSFFQHLAQHCLLLESLLFSTAARGAQPWIEQTEAEEDGDNEGVYLMLFTMFPRVSSWGLPFDELAVAGMRRESRLRTRLHLLVVENRVTTLEIVPGTWPFDGQYSAHFADIFDRERDARCLLDRFLRDSPQLLHLKAKGVPFIGAFKTRLWACRGLKTLSVLYRDQYSTYKTPYAIYRLQGGESRRLFGYLSRMCPALEELEVEITGEVLALRRGLCLLTRMQWLKRLTIRMNIDNWDGWDPRVNTLDEDDFAWILRFPKSSSSPSSSSSWSSWSSSLLRPPSLYISSVTKSYFPARQVPLEEEYKDYQSKRLDACLLKIQNDDFYDCDDKKSRTSPPLPPPHPPPSSTESTPTVWEKIRSAAIHALLQGVAEPLDMINDWKNGQKRRAASTRKLKTIRQCLYWTDFDRKADEWPVVDGLTEEWIGSLLEVESRLLALIEGQTQLQTRMPEQQQIILVGNNEDKNERNGNERWGGREKAENPPIWKKSGAVGDIVVAGPWSFMDELRIEYRPTACWRKDKVLREHVPRVQKMLRQMRPDIEIDVTHHSYN